MAFSGSLNFISASLTGSENINVDFVGINTLIVDPVGASSNLLGHSSDVDSVTYINEHFMKPRATITVDDGNNTSALFPLEKKYINITSTDGTSKRYVVTNAVNDGSTATGTVLSDADDTDTGGSVAGPDEDGGIAVSIDLNSDSQNDYLVQLKIAIQHANGHNGKIIVSSVPTEADGEQTITLTQIAGSNSKTAITTNISMDDAGGILTINHPSIGAEFFPGYFVNPSGLSTEPTQLNSLLLHRNGPYQHPSWKQYRGGDHSIARALRLNNTMSIDGAYPDARKREDEKRGLRDRREAMSFIELTTTDPSDASGKAVRELTIHFQNENKTLRAFASPTGENLGDAGIADGNVGNDPYKWPTTGLYAFPDLKQYYEPVLTTKHKPFIYKTTLDDGSPIVVRASLMNQMMDFSSDKLNDKLRLASGDPTTGSKENVDFRRSNQNIYNILQMATKYEGTNFVYSERIYPKEINSYRPYKLEKPSYEQVSGHGPNGYDKAERRLFWKNAQGGNAKSATSDGSTRLRTDGGSGVTAPATSSVGVIQTTAFPELIQAAGSGERHRPEQFPGTNYTTARQLISSSVTYASAAFHAASSSAHTSVWDLDGSSEYGNFGSSMPTGSYGINITTTSLDLGLQGLVVEYANNGVVINRYQTTGDAYWPHQSGTLFQLDSYQPYQISLLSVWPLDVRDDIYNKPNKPPYLTSSLGGVGYQIGLTPHRNSSLTSPASHDTYTLHSGSGPNTTSSILTAVGNTYTASAGELAYSTKPTVFFWRNSLVHNTSSLILSASSVSAMHAFAHVGKAEEKIELQDAQGNKVGFHFITSSTNQDGRTVETSGSTFVEVGVESMIWSQELFERLGNAINSVNSYDNGLTLNLYSELHSSGLEASGSIKELRISQATPGSGMAFKLVRNRASSSAGWQDPYDSEGHASAGGILGGMNYQLTGITASSADYFMGDNNGSQGPTSPAGWKATASLADDAMMGYKAPTASLQYNRHTFPYNTPFYVTNRIRQRNPFYDSYSDYAAGFKYLGRDFSHIPEFRYSEHIDYYNISDQYSQKIFSLNFIPTFVGGGEHPESTNKFKRAVAFGDPDSPSAKQKADFLFLDGANVTSSASEENYDPTSSTTRYEYDDINGAIAAPSAVSPDDNASYLSNQQSVDFYGKYGITDSIINFSHLLDQNTKAFLNDVDTTPAKVTFNLSAVKKLLPYNGFYPVTRTTQIGNAFKSDITKFTDEDGFKGQMTRTPKGQTGQDQAYIQSLLEPFMAPGILYNSIKSGISVDYPIYYSSPNYYFPPEFVIMPGSVTQNTVHGLQPAVLSSSYHGGLYMMGASRCMPAILTSKHQARLPFKALYDIEAMKKSLGRPVEGTEMRPFMHLVSDFVDFDRFSAGATLAGTEHSSGKGLIPSHRSGTLGIGDPSVRFPNEDDIGTIEGQTYHSMINNYLSETMEFFLADLNPIGTKLPVISSGLKEAGITGLQDGVDYLMEVSLKMGKYQVNCEGPRQAGIGDVDGLFDDRGHGAKADHLNRPTTTITVEDYSQLVGQSGAGIAFGIDPTVDVAGHYSAMVINVIWPQAGGAGHDYGTMFDAGTSNNATAEEIKDAINSITGQLFVATRSNNVITVTYLGRTEADNLKVYVIDHIGEFYTTPAANTKGNWSSHRDSSGITTHLGLKVKDFTGGGGDRYFFRNSSMRGYIYGPPIEIVPHAYGRINKDWSHEKYQMKDSFIDGDDFSGYLAANLQDPAYHAYTPPYFYGKSSFVFKLASSLPDGTSVADVRNEIIADNISFYADTYDRPVSGSEAGSSLKVSPNSLSIITPNTASVSLGSNAKMRLDSSVELYGELVPILVDKEGADDVSTHVWSIAPEWVCPVLDFSSSYAAIYDHPINTQLITSPPSVLSIATTITNSYHDITTGRGLWGGYGTDPYDTILMEEAVKASGHVVFSTSPGGPVADSAYVNGKGIYLEVGEFVPDTSDSKQDETTNYLTNLAEDSFYGSPESAPVSVASLGDALGFTQNKPEKYQIGKFAESKTIHEAVVLIPYVDKPINILLNPDTMQANDLELGKTPSNNPVNSVYSTREIIPGKHFLPIQERIFENILSLHILRKTKGEGYRAEGPNADPKSIIFGTTADAATKAIYNLPRTISTDPSQNAPDLGIENVFFNEWIKNAADEALNETDIGKMIEQLSSFNEEHGGFMLPQEFDFIHNKNVPPFQIIVMPLDHRLRKQELIDIYQGILPDSGLRTELINKLKIVQPGFAPSYDSLYSPLFPAGSQLTNFLSPAAFSDDILNNLPTESAGTLRPYKTAREFYKNLRFMVFKVKQRAKKDYKNYRLSQIAKAVENTTIKGNVNAIIKTDSLFSAALNNRTVGDVYGANWPYDYFSLIETAKIDIELEVKE